MVALQSWLLAEDVEPKMTVVAGDSAGGELTLALTVALRKRCIAAPARNRWWNRLIELNIQET
jgi:monoterpene epsilon-lactone hydrolase